MGNYIFFNSLDALYTLNYPRLPQSVQLLWNMLEWIASVLENSSVASIENQAYKQCGNKK